MSLVAWYPLIDGSLENKGLDTTPLTLHGTVPFTNGRVRTAPTFSANTSNYYTMPPITKVNDFSICCWVKISADVSTSNWIVWQGVVSNNNRFGFVYLGDTNSIGFRMGSFVQNSTIEKDKWYHLCMTMNDTNTVVCYINGNAVGTGLYEGYSFTENEALYLGKSKDTSEPLNGQLQDFRYYDHCLSPKEVKEIAKGLCLHLPLKGTNARPNLFKNSATMFNTFGLYPQGNPPVTSRELVFDENAPCGINGKILRYNIERTSSDQAWAVGEYFTPSLGSNFLPELTIGSTYCVSYWARCSIDNKVTGVQNFVSGTLIKSSDLKLTSEWKRYYQIFIATSTGVSNSFYVSKINVGDKGVFEVCCPKLELLSPTPYIPNVDDTQYSDYVLDYEPDCSGNEFDATKYGDLTTSDSNGRYNTAVAFNGTNAYLQGLAPTNSECKEFTIATWVKLNNLNNTYGFYCSRTLIGTAGVLFAYDSQKAIRLTDGGVTTLFTDTAFEANKWYHVAVTRTGTEKKCYINGELKATATTIGTLSNMSDNYTIGFVYGYISYLNGSLSDFRLYTSALSADDVKELYETSVSIAHNPPSLTESAYYNYVETQKHSTFDKSKFTVVGSPTITDDGVASGFSRGNYLTTTQTLGNSIKVFSTFKTPQSDNVTANSAIWQIKTSPTIELQVVGQKMFIINSGGTISAGNFNFEHDTWYDTIFEYNFTTGAYKLSYKKSADNNYIELTGTQSGWVNMSLSDIVIDFGTMNRYFWYTGGSIDLKQFFITVDGEEVFNGNKTGLDVINDIEIPYTLGSTGIKIVDSTYLDRVKDVYDQHYLERYYTVDETTQTVYEYPLFRDSMHSYEFDEGFDQSIKKVGVMISPEFTETTDVNMVKGNTKTTKLIEV